MVSDIIFDLGGVLLDLNMEGIGEACKRLGINPELLINMQTRYNMSVARQKKPLLDRLVDIKRACAAILA